MSAVEFFVRVEHAFGSCPVSLVRLELRVAELERLLPMDSSAPETPSSKERIGAKEGRRARQQSERECRKDRKRGKAPAMCG